jgi:hypothetical protein
MFTERSAIRLALSEAGLLSGTSDITEQSQSLPVQAKRSFSLMDLQTFVSLVSL